jgi:hypothetical protein
MIDVGRIQRHGRGKKMAEALEFEKADEHGNPIKRLKALNINSPRKPRAKKQRIDTTEASLDEDDLEYQDADTVESESTSASEPLELDGQDTFQPNAEVSSLLYCFHSANFTCRSLPSYHPRRSLLQDGELPESACAQSQRSRQRLLTKSNLSAARKACAATWKHPKKS